MTSSNVLWVLALAGLMARPLLVKDEDLTSSVEETVESVNVCESICQEQQTIQETSLECRGISAAVHNKTIETDHGDVCNCTLTCSTGAKL